MNKTKLKFKNKDSAEKFTENFINRIVDGLM